MLPPANKPEKLAEDLGEVLPMLTHPKTGATLLFAGMGSKGMATKRLETAEAILHWLRGQKAMPDPNKPKKPRMVTPT